MNLERKSDDLTQQLRRKLILLFSAILEFQAKAACRFGEHWVQRTLRNTFKTDDWRVALSNIINLHKQCMDVEVLLDFIDRRSDSIAMKSLLEKNGDLMRKFVENFQNDRYRDGKILVWLSNNLVEGDHDEIRANIGSRYWKTGLWFLQQFNSWLSTDSTMTVLWGAWSR